MNAQASTTKAPSYDDIAASAFNTQVKNIVSGIGSAEKTLVELVCSAASRWYGVDKGGCDVINNLINALSDYPVKQGNAAKVFKKILPHVLIEIDESGKATTKNHKLLSALSADEKSNGATLVAAFASLKHPSLAAAVKSDGKAKEKVFKPLKAGVEVAKTKTFGADMLARLMLSNDGLTLEEAKRQIASYILNLSVAEVNKAKDEVLAKTPMPEPINKAA